MLIFYIGRNVICVCLGCVLVIFRCIRIILWPVIWGPISVESMSWVSWLEITRSSICSLWCVELAMCCVRLKSLSIFRKLFEIGSDYWSPLIIKFLWSWKCDRISEIGLINSIELGDRTISTILSFGHFTIIYEYSILFVLWLKWWRIIIEDLMMMALPPP